MQAAAVHKTSQRKAPPAPGTRGMFRLGDLVASPLNVRKTPRTTEAVVQMAVSIHHHGGVLQNLLLVPHVEREVWTGRFGVAGGETRRQALCMLRDGGVQGAEGFTDDFLVPGLVVAAPEAAAVSATENVRRTPLSPADEFEAFRELYEQCGSVEHVAEFFAVTPLAVERRLKLANASPDLYRLFREGSMSLEQLMALCLTDDHARQERVWHAGAKHEYLRSAQQLRRVLTEGKVSVSSHRVARFVGMRDYEAAGGAVVRELFSEAEDDGYIADDELLQRLAGEKLDAVAAKVREEGWAWVLVCPEFDYAQQARFGRCEVRKAGARYVVEEAAKPMAGAVVSLDSGGVPQILRGLVKPEDRKALEKKKRAAAKARKAGAGDGAERKSQERGLSESLVRRLTAHRTVALQRVLADNAQVALAALAHNLVQRIWHETFWPASAVQIRAETMDSRMLSLGEEELERGRAWQELQQLRQAWGERLPGDQDKLLAWLIALPMSELCDLLALCVALSVNAICGSDAAHDADALAVAVKLDMANWWEVSAPGYLDLVPKALAVAAVREAVSETEAATLERLKKPGAVARAQALLAGTRWLPAVLRTRLV